MFKNQLQELAQRSCFNLPSYSCIREGPDHAPRFKATVNFNGETFESPNFCNTLRQAEHAAAEVALGALSKRGPSRSLAARVLDETGVYKNLLQEIAHRAGLDLPVYITVPSGPGHTPPFTCTVELAGMKFLGDLAKTKKQAQKNAALAAWTELRQLPNMGSSSSLLESENNEQEKVIIARALANMCKGDGSKSVLLNDQKNERLKQPPVQPQINGIGRSHSYSRPCYQNWLYSNLNPKVEIYQAWNQEQFIHQQSHLLTLPTLPPNDPRNFPHIRSIQPIQSQYFTAIEQDPLTSIPFYQEATSSSCLNFTPRSRCQVSIQEINERSDEGEKKPLCNVSSDAEENHKDQKTDPLPGAASTELENPNLSASGKPSAPKHSHKDKQANNSSHITELPSEGDPDVGNPIVKRVFIQPHISSVRSSVHRNKRPQMVQQMPKNTYYPPVQNSSFTAHTHQLFNSIHPASHVHPPSAMASSILPTHVIGTATGITIPAYGSGHGVDAFRPRTPLMAAPVTVRTAVPVYSARHASSDPNSCVPLAMAPAVGLRCVASACSAPPSMHAPVETTNLENQGSLRMASEFGRLHL